MAVSRGGHLLPWQVGLHARCLDVLLCRKDARISQRHVYDAMCAFLVEIDDQYTVDCVSFRLGRAFTMRKPNSEASRSGHIDLTI